ncbi:MAG TPA: MMPL family transporter, partial [Gemmataceae bacterium]|nr:MMPL family transporter [Gemmataceae bacterium]
MTTHSSRHDSCRKSWQRAPAAVGQKLLMFQVLGKLVSRAWLVLLAGWIIGLGALALVAPRWGDVAQSGQLNFLPHDVPSIRAKDLLKAAFPNDVAESNIVLVLSRDDEIPIYEYRDFIERDLKGGLQYLGEEPESPITHIHTPADRGAGALLINGYGNAALVVLDLTAEFMGKNAWPTIEAVEHLIENLRRENRVPYGLDIDLTGSAVIGRDIRQAETKSASAIDTWTVGLVIVLLLIIYRAPLLALIPLATVFVAVQVSIKLLTIMAKHDFFTLSETNRVYISVLGYGAGVDYCLFLTARYREELQSGTAFREALANAIGKVGGTITASAATVICGIAMLLFGQFGKYHQAGITIPFTLVIVLFAALTFAPSLLRLTGRWAFWPRPSREHSSDQEAGLLERISRQNQFHGTWDKIGHALKRRPGPIWLACVAGMAPFAWIAVQNYNYWDYGVINDVPRDAPSRAGTNMLERHFNPGVSAPITVLVRSATVDFTTAEGTQLVTALGARLEERKDALKIEDIRSAAKPLGMTAAAKDIYLKLDELSEPELYKEMRQQALAYYVSAAGDLKGHVARLEVIGALDPLSRAGIENLNRIQTLAKQDLPPELKDAEIEFAGASAGLRDLQDVTTADLQRMELAVPAVVFVILLIFLREL